MKEENKHKIPFFYKHGIGAWDTASKTIKDLNLSMCL